MGSKLPTPPPVGREAKPSPPPPLTATAISRPDGIRDARLWVVGQLFTEDELDDHTWQLVGIFDSEAKADAACTTINHFYGVSLLNERLPDHVIRWPNAVFPRLALRERAP